jgi:uncharacterized protein YjbI with pentapeptide repeats
MISGVKTAFVPPINTTVMRQSACIRRESHRTSAEMADQEQLQILKEGFEHWNPWKRAHPGVVIYLDYADLQYADLKESSLGHAHFTHADLSNADLRSVDLSYAKLSYANLSGADLRGAFIEDADLTHAMLSDANFHNATLSRSDFSDSDLSNADFSDADLSRADFSNANLRGANLRGANLDSAIFVNTDLSNANLEGCSVYGVSAWGLTLDGANQKNLVITPYEEPRITVDDLEVAQFIYLMLNNQKVRRVINTITTKVVLILGRFTAERMVILEAVREELRRQDYLPLMFDFEGPATRDLTETVSALAHMARFIIADVTDPKSIPQELQAIVPHLPSVPVQPLRLAGTSEYGMFEHFKRYPWVLPTHVYESSDELITDLREKVILPAESKAKGLRD